MKLIHIIFGWLLGILSPHIMDFIKNIVYEFGIWNWKIDSEEKLSWELLLLADEAKEDKN